jgi:hypothetical protein
MHDISVKDAIRKGQKMINWPVAFIIMAAGGGVIFAAATGVLPGWAYLGGIIIAFLLAWIYWSIMIVRWRLWAFEHVQHVHHLHKTAITERLIWPDGSWLSKTEIWTKEQRQKWEVIQGRFNQPDDFENDFTVPSETIICFSKSRNLGEMAIMLCIAAFGVYTIVADIHLYVGIGLIIFGLAVAIREYRQATNTTPQITINEKGITTAKHGFTSWKDIKDEDVILERVGRHQYGYLVFNSPIENVKVSIDDFDIDRYQLHHLLKVYQVRAMKRRT